jgi:hypothetical protein
MDEIVVTLSPATHEVVKVERLGKAGARRELSEQECAELAGGDEVDALVVAVQEAYEAGVLKGLDQDDDFDEVDEALIILQLLHRLLLRRLLRRRLPHRATSQQQRRKQHTEQTERGRNGSASKI